MAAAREWKGLLGFAFLLLAARMLFLLAALDPAEERANQLLDRLLICSELIPGRPLHDAEELYAGAAARAFDQVASASPDAFQYMPYGRGSVVIAQLAAPLLRWFGPTCLAFKLLGLAVTTIGGVAWFATVRIWFGRRIAGWFAALWLLAPSMFVRTSLIAKGDHAEAMAAIGVLLLLGTAAARARHAAAAAALAALTGTLFGLSLRLTYSVGPIVAAVAVAALLRTRGRPFLAWAAFAGGLGVGLIPLLGALTSNPTLVGAIYGRSLLDWFGFEEAGRRAWQMMKSGFFAQYDLPRSVAGPAAVACTLVAGVGCVRWFRAAPRFASWASLAGVGAHLGAALFVAPGASGRYLVPLWPLLLLAMAGFATLHRRAWLGPVLLLVVGGAAQSRVVTRSAYVAIDAPLRGADLNAFGGIVAGKVSPEAVSDYPPSFQVPLWRGIGFAAAPRLQRKDWPKTLRRAGASAEPLLEGLGARLAAESPPPDWATALAIPAQRAAFLRGIERFAEVPVKDGHLDLASCNGWLAVIDAEEGRPIRRSLARAAATLALHSPDSSAPGGAELAAFLTAETAERAYGYVRFRSLSSDGTLRLWPAPSDLRTTAELLASPEFVTGLADAFEWQLDVTDPRALEGVGESTPYLARLLTGLSSRTRPAVAAPFARAAGHVLARLASDERQADPDAGPTGDPTRPPRWSDGLSQELRGALLAGLAAGPTLRTPGPNQ
jgi:hypothetical protein